jgi:hypothetical protein
MSKHTFPKGHKFGGNKPKPYKTIRINKNVPEAIHGTIMDDITTKCKEYVKNLKITLKD